MSRTCSDYASLGLCNGSWPSLDVAYHGLRPSEACCVCGGGSVQPSPTQMALASQSLYVGQSILAFPAPLAQGVSVDSDCNLAELGLEINTSGVVSGTVKKAKSSSEVKCSVVMIQDPVRGISNSLSLDVPVTAFSYGEQVLLLKSWGLEAAAATSFPVQKAKNLSLENYELQCVPECPWVEMDARIYSSFF